MDLPQANYLPVDQQEPNDGQTTNVEAAGPRPGPLELNFEPVPDLASTLDSHTGNASHQGTRPRNGSVAIQINRQDGYSRPLRLMVSSLLMGGICCGFLHWWYKSFDGKPANHQAFALRVGTFLAFCAQAFFVFSIEISFDQWLWKELKNNPVSVRTIDAGFAALGDPFSFINFEMLNKLKCASTLALVAWLMFIPTLFTPATLNVRPNTDDTNSSMLVPVLDISQAAPYTSYTYTVIGDPPTLQKYLGPRTIVTRIAVAAAATGEILALPPPATNATYTQTFFAPYVDCENSTVDVRRQTDDMMQRMKQETGPSLEIISLDYFAAIPALNNLGNTAGSTVEVANLTDVDDYLHASNQLWVYFAHYNASSDFSQPRQDHYLTCSLYNSSYSTRVTFRNGQQTLEIEQKKLNRVFYPANASSTAISEVQMSYSAVFWALSNQLTGMIAFYKDLNVSNDATQQTYSSRIYSKILSNIAQTVLLGTSDLSSHFEANHLLANTSDGKRYSTQRLQDVAYAHNKTLDILIPELSSNITHSLFTDPLLAPSQAINVTVSTMVNVFTYHSRNVAIAYTIAGTVALLATIAALYVFSEDRVSHNLSFSSIACATRAVRYPQELRPHEMRGVLPLPKTIAEMQLQFLDDNIGQSGFRKVVN